MRAFPFAHCILRVWANDFIETVFEDGGSCPALLTDTDQNRRDAAELGYGLDTLRMHVEHELSHTLLAEAMGLPYSPTLRDVAAPGSAPADTRASEEAFVFSFQRYLCTGARAPELDSVPDLDAVAARVRDLSQQILPR